MIRAVLRRFGYVPVMVPDFQRLDAETMSYIQDIREASDKAEAVECAEALAGIWRAELERVTQ